MIVLQVMEEMAGGDLLMECDEEEEKVEKHNEALQAVAPMMEEEEEPEEVDDEPEEEEPGEEGGSEPPVRIIPIPVEPVNCYSPSTHTNTLTCAQSSSGAPPGFMVNGQLVPLLPGGGGAELKLLSHPSGSASGFTTVQIPVTLTLHSPAGTHNIHTTASLTACTAPPEPEPTPIITGVVSGEAAQKVLSDHNVNFITQNLQLKEQKSPITPSRCRPPAANKLLRKGQLGHVSPPDCLVCMSQFKLIIELRGFMCLCSPAIAQSLKNLKRKKKTCRRSREKKKNKSSREPQTCSKVSRSQPGSKVTSPIQKAHIRPDDFPSDQFTSPTSPSSACSPQQDPSEPTPDPPHGKLVIMVDDFYYGSDCGQTFTKLTQLARKYTGPYRCIHCPQTLGNNIQLMSHMQQHVSTMSQQDKHMDSVSSCPHCFRHFNSPFRLQCHLEAVHSQYESTAKCKICELVFGTEPAFLWHMKSTHRPGEMPYVCQVCDFRSSFYSDVWSHFQEAHANSNHLLCQYCLRVLRSSSCYQQHFARHQRKTVFGCDKCRLHFLYIKERTEHRLLHHRTHIRPTQLTGLKPGTKVTVRTYSVVGGSVDTEAQNRAVAPCKVVDIPGPPPQDAPKRRPVESLGPLLTQLSQDSEVADLSRPSRCVECLTSVQDFSSHFPSLVHCSLCRFTTCCSKAYANHMINNHAAWRKRPHYHSIFQSDSRLCQRLSCVSCPFSTSRGDMMANHLTERPKHCCIITHSERRINRAQQQPTHTSDSVTSSGSRGGAFIPIHLLPSGQTSPQLSVKPLTSPSPLSSPAAMTIKFLGPRPQAAQPPASLSVSQLSVLLFSLCNGLLQAACRFQTPPLKIRSWTEQRQRQLSDGKWHWKTEKMAAWVLSQREQQLCVSEDMLLQTARRVLGEDSQLMDHYSWAVDFMLRHHLSLQLTGGNHHRLPRDVKACSLAFIRLLSSKIAGGPLPPRSVGFMDELAVFVDPDRFSDQSLSALQLFGSAAETPLLDVVLSALSDGTFLTPLLFFRGTAADVPDGFPENVLLEARLDGFTEQERLHIWTHKVWRPHLASLPDSQSLLMVDVHRGHLTDEFRGSMSALSTELVFIPAGCCCCCQPLDLCVTPVLREFLQARWTQLVSQGGLDGLTLGQLALTLGCWFSEVSSMLNANTNILHRSFSSVCDPQQEETAKMIQVLTEMLIQPLENSDVPPPAAVEEVELLLVMQNEEEPKKNREQLVGSQPALRQVFDGDSDQDSFLGFEDE
ncbi:hypothetical protein PAMP_008566 [Pampus punctatissimus]